MSPIRIASVPVLALPLLALLAPPALAGGSVRINELLASNGGGLVDEDGDESDWIELHNPTGTAVSLAGWRLTDDASDLAKWTFPAVSIPAGGYLVVFASDKDRAVAGGELHTSFKLTADGEYLGLVASGGAVVHEYAPAFPPQEEDVSYGLDAALQQRFFPQPTPGAANGAGYEGIVADTSFDVDRGFFQSSFVLTISTPTPGATIRYTLNGSAPSPTQGTVYTGPLTISTTRVVRAIAYRAGWLPTDVDTQTYLFLGDVVNQPAIVPGYPNPTYDVGSGSQSVVHDWEMDPNVVNHPAYAGEVIDALRAIPTLSVAVAPGEIFGASGFYDGEGVEKSASVEVLYPDDPGASHQANGGIESHSHLRLKRSLRLNFRASYGDAKWETDLLSRAPLGGTSALEEYDVVVLRGGNNRSWARNWNPARTAYTIDQFYRESQIATSGFGTRGAFVHLYVNGLYWGLFNVVERPDEKFTAAHFGGDDDDWFALNHSGPLSGDATRWNWLKGGLLNQDLTTQAGLAHLAGFLDLDAFSDYLIVSWWTGTGDWPWNNWYGGNRSTSSPLGTTPHRYFCWDGEWSWDAPKDFSNPGFRAHVHPLFKANVPDGPTLPTTARLWHNARTNGDFRMLFADRVFANVRTGGPLSDAVALERWQVLNDLVRSAVVAESARWGDALESLGHPLYTRDVHWQNQVDTIASLIGGNGAVFLAALRAEGFYPSIDPPAFAPEPGVRYAPYAVSLSAASGSGTIWYTTDGSDPRAAGGGIQPWAQVYGGPIAVLGSLELRARTRTPSGEWSALNAGSFAVAVDPSIRYGCGVNPLESVVLLAGEPRIGQPITIGVDDPLGAHGAGAATFLAVSGLPDFAFPCGTLLDDFGMAGSNAPGELLVSFLSPLYVVAGPPWPGSAPAQLTLELPYAPNAVGNFLYFQGAVLDAATGLGLTDAIAVQILP